MARESATRQTKQDPQEGVQAPAGGAPGRAPSPGGTSGLPQPQGQVGAFPSPRPVTPGVRGSEVHAARRYRVKTNMAAAGDASLKGGYRVMEPTSLQPGAGSYSGILPAGRIITDATHNIARLRAQGVDLEELDPPLVISPVAVEVESEPTDAAVG